ncbi:Uncharacterised protein [Shigella sonnei]|nr:Uncharacterised protein [Shigella sonnei]
MNNVLHDDWAFVQIVIHIVSGCANNLHTTFIGLVIRTCADKRRQE